MSLNQVRKFLHKVMKMNNWPVKKLGEICSTTQGVQIPKSDQKNHEVDGYKRYLYISDFYSSENLKYVQDKYPEKIVTDRDIIMANTGTPGKAFRGVDGILSNNLFKISIKDSQLDSGYLFYYLTSSNFQRILQSQMKHGIQMHLGHVTVQKQQIVIPPNNIQKKIVERLDAIRKAQELCEEQIQKTEELFESILETEATSDSTNIHELNFFTEKVTYGFTNPMPTSNEGPYMVTAKDITEGEVNYYSCRRTTQEAYDKLITDKSRPELEDILLTKDGTLGRIALVTIVPLCINQSVALIKPNKTTVIPQYLKLLLESSKYQRIMKANAGGAIIKHIYITTIDKMKIAVPGLKKQQEIVKKLEAVQNYKKLLQKEKLLLKELFDSVIDRSMKGELDN